MKKKIHSFFLILCKRTNHCWIQIPLPIRKIIQIYRQVSISFLIKKPRNFGPTFMVKNHRCRTFIHFHTHLKDHQIVPKFKFLYQFEKDLSKSKRNSNFQTHFMIKNENFRPSFNHDKVNSAQRHRFTMTSHQDAQYNIFVTHLTFSNVVKTHPVPTSMTHAGTVLAISEAVLRF